MGAKRLDENPTFHARSKHIDVRHHFIRDALKKKLVELERVPTNDMTAGALTKGLSRPKHQQFVKLLGLGSLSQS